ncbi:DUF3515 domain-containing protein [Mycobacterium sp. PS03-16]|uniref:DUF3515 domain-containing protein n=1 Tax=Mycobacterium sp. PS03-16 TaxID=2559611 RepID=UPI0010741E1A|nr:DUF3515 domain-containing protein [Mycobacterium sp. PS03-16]TFV60452.1 DUF3515 domain-containing protein [Mycobacterium sp. PS03-16]
MIAAILVAVAALVVVLGIAAVRQGSPEQRPVAIAAVPAPRADGPECRALLTAVPDLLGDFRRAPTAEPTPAGAAAWQAGPDTEAIILRCGLDRPVDFVVGAPLQVVDAVSWFRVGEEAAPGSRQEPEQTRSTWYAVDRPVYVALTLPRDSGPTPIQVMSRVLADTMPARPLDPGPPR